MDWTVNRVVQYARWRAKVEYKSLGRRARLAYVRCAHWLPQRDPDFLSIGAPRAASTWLYSRLSLHPHVCLPKRKEIHFFDVRKGKGTYVYGPDLRRPLFKTMDLDDSVHWRWYRTYFGRCDRTKLTGDFTPDYSLLGRERIEIVKQHLPNIKVIYTLRDPVERAWSSIRKELWWRFHMHPHEVDVDTLVRMAMQPGILARGDYKSVIDRWETCFKERMFYLFYDDITESPSDALRRTCEFLGLDPDLMDVPGGHSKRINDVPGDDIPNEVRESLERYYSDQAGFLMRKFGRAF